MIEELLYWPIKNRNLINLGKRVEEINQEFMLLDTGLANGTGSEGVANLHRARSLTNKITNLLERCYNLNPQSRFDSLVLKNFTKSLFAQKEYIQFFFTKKYNKDWGMRSFLNYVFLPAKEFEGKPDENGAMAFLEDKLRNINYRAITKRENLMKDVLTYMAAINPSEIGDLILEQIPRLRRMIAAYNQEMGFETKEQIEAQQTIEEKKEIENARTRLKRILGPSMEGIYDLMKMQQKKANYATLSKQIEITEELNQLVYDLVLNQEDYCAYDHAIRTMEFTENRIHLYKDKKTGKIRAYTGDLDVDIGHENYHRMQSYFSRFMPHGLRDTPGELSLTARTIMEGTATILEENFLEWLSKDNNRKRFNLSKQDLKIAKLFDHEHFGNRLIRLCHSLYHREVSSAEGKTDYDAHVKLAEVSKVPIHADEYYLQEESIAETFYYSLYFFGKKYAMETLEELEKRETRRLGTKRKAKNFIKRNEPILIQGLLTGSWGWSTHKDFFLNLYWPKARKYCK